jgi:hypothetical protein
MADKENKPYVPLILGQTPVPFGREEYNIAYQKYNEVFWKDVNDPISAFGAALECFEFMLYDKIRDKFGITISGTPIYSDKKEDPARS